MVTAYRLGNHRVRSDRLVDRAIPATRDPIAFRNGGLSIISHTRQESTGQRFDINYQLHA